MQRDYNDQKSFKTQEKETETNLSFYCVNQET